jgi:4'-phosphopantetheinyl transferase
VRDGNDVTQLADWRLAPTCPPLRTDAVHVWRIDISQSVDAGPYRAVLAPDEQAKARRFRLPELEAAYVVAHGAMRSIIAAYERVHPDALRFGTTESGKPTLLSSTTSGRLEFSLSHSGDLALLAVTRDRAVGIDIEQWNADLDHFHVAERCFSPAELHALRSLAGNRERVVEGFYSAWSRKEAYLKATGQGVSHGLDHFDVSLGSSEPAALIADRLDSSAPSRWKMFALTAGARYSAALAVAAPVGKVELFDAPGPETRHATHASTKPARTSAM